ncbi:MAG: hypothetical protein P1U40_05105 [Coxiellaceae bacterium]|nr:hypothetical protein [Coxiellaceae bacterium]
MEYASQREAFTISSGIAALCFVAGHAMSALLGVATLGRQAFESENVTNMTLASGSFAAFAFAVCYTSMVDPDTLAYRGIVQSDFFHLRRQRPGPQPLPAEPELEVDALTREMARLTLGENTAG